MTTTPFPCPLTLTCKISGKKVTYSDPEYIKARIEKAGSLEALVSNYVSRSAKGELNRQGKPVQPKGKSWKGEQIAAPAPAKPQDPDTGEKVPIVHHVFKIDSGECNVYFPRQHPDQLLHQTFDLRPKRERPNQG